MGDSHNKISGTHGHSHKEHEVSILQELACHLPYGTFSVAFGFIFLSVIHFMSLGFSMDRAMVCHGYHILFHSFHYLHLIFAIAGTFVAFSRFSKNLFHGLLISIVSPSIFCTLSDIALPALAGQILGVHMHMHICFFSLPDLMNVIPFMLIGLITGYAISRHHTAALEFVSLTSHFVHILISSLAATFYTVSYGFESWPSVMGLLFLLLVIAVVIPCTISDVIVPLYFSRCTRKKQ